MEQLEVTPENNYMWITNPEADFPEPGRLQIPIFEEDPDGNIIINFWRIDRTRIMYYKMGKGKMSDVNATRKEWKQIRLKEPQGDRKYMIPAGQGTWPFFPPLLVNAFEKGEELETLYLTEGAFKAWLACLYGIPTVGLTSITHYRDKDTGMLHADVLRLIETCQVKNLVILWDADCLDISINQLKDRVDLTKRPAGFFSAVQNIRGLIQKHFEELEAEADCPKVFFFHVKSESFSTQPKGLDDLLIAAREEERSKEVVRDSQAITANVSPFFYKKNITSTTNTLKAYFKLHDVELFYHRHAEDILYEEFIFKGSVYVYHKTKEELELVAPEWAQKIKWIGDYFFKVVDKPNAHGDIQRELVKRSKQTLMDLHGKQFIRYIQHYEGFCNVPNHFNYEQTCGMFYNRYFPFKHRPAEGKCDESLSFIKHIFGEEPVEYKGRTILSYELGLDYLQLLITRPTQMLPVLVLYSPENNTGKSTFGKWEKAIFQHNAIQIGNQDFKSQFNEHWTDKLLAICEETLLERKKDAEVIKAYATSTNIMVNPKGFTPFEIDFFCKFQFYSNNKRMIYLNKYDQRFWIRRVPVPRKDNPGLLAKLEKEIPAFLHFIVHRELVTNKESRMWFHHTLIRTKEFYETVNINEPSEVRNLRFQLKEMFLDFSEEEIKMPLKNINSEFFGNRATVAWLKEILHDYLGADILKNGKGQSIQIRGKYYKYDKSYDLKGDETTKKTTVHFNGRPYVFYREDFVTEHDEFIIQEEP